MQGETGTLYSFDLARSEGGLKRFEYVVGRTICSWLRHELDPQGRYLTVGRCSAAQVADALWAIDPERAMSELLDAAAALDRAQADLLAEAEDAELSDDASVWPLRRAMHLRRARLDLLDILDAACDRWPQSAGDPLPGKSPAAVRRLVRELTARDYPERREAVAVSA